MQIKPSILCCLLSVLILNFPTAHSEDSFNWWDWYSNGTSSGTTNLPPTITGDPPASVIAGQGYSFTPTVSDPERAPLLFSIVNLPSWASFNQLNGTLYGTPSSTNTGLYEGIQISVSDGVNSASLGPISIMVNRTGTALLSWKIPTSRADGTALSLSEIDGFRIYMGQSNNQMSLIMDLNDNSATSYSITDLKIGTYYFAVTTYDTEGNESTFSNIADKTIL